jgi:small subunit ribosomal protein S18
MEKKKKVIKRRGRRQKPCFFCVEKQDVLDYKNVGVIRRFLTERGKIYPRRNSGICAKHQRMLAEAVKRSRYMGLVPFCVE